MDYIRDPANAGTKGRGSKREQLVGDNWVRYKGYMDCLYVATGRLEVTLVFVQSKVTWQLKRPVTYMGQSAFSLLKKNFNFIAQNLSNLWITSSIESKTATLEAYSMRSQ